MQFSAVSPSPALAAFTTARDILVPLQESLATARPAKDVAAQMKAGTDALTGAVELLKSSGTQVDVAPFDQAVALGRWASSGFAVLELLPGATVDSTSAFFNGVEAAARAAVRGVELLS